MPVGQAPLDNTMSLTFGNEKSSILSVLPHYLLNNGFLLNRQAELDLQAFPNGVWEREKRAKTLERKISFSIRRQ